MAVLTTRQEAFAQELAKGTAQAKAYRRAYPNWKGSDKALAPKASAAASSDKIRVRVSELRAPVIVKVRYEYEQALTEAEEARAMAKEQESPDAITRAVALKAKLSGLMVEDRKNDRDPFSEFDYSDTERAMQAVKAAVAKAKETA